MQTVTVGCKLPNGLVLRLFKNVKQSENVMGGGRRDFDIWQPTGDEYTLRGHAVRKGMDREGEVMAGYMLNHGVPKDFWDKWLAQNKDTAFVRSGAIFGQEKEAMARDEAKEKRDVRTGLEPLDPKKMPKKITLFTETAEA